MTRDQAVAEAARLGREHPDRGRSSWLAGEADGGGWEVVRIGVPSRPPLEVRTGREQEPVSPHEDPRPPVSPDVGFG